MQYIVPVLFLIPLLFIILLGYIFFRILKIDAAFSPFIAISAIVVWLILFGSVKLLWFGCLLAYVGVPLCFLLIARRSPTAFVKYIKSPAIVIFVAGSIGLALFYIFNGNFYFRWDDFSHWGPFYKTVHYTNEFHIFSDWYLIHRTYPQATTVLYYFISWLYPTFEETHTFLSLGILMVSCSTCFMAKSDWHRPILTNLKMICVPVFFLISHRSEAYYSVYLDTVLGAVFGATLLVIACGDINNKGHLAATILSLAMLTQVKEMGLWLALGCFGLYLLFSFFQQPKTQKLGKHIKGVLTLKWIGEKFLVLTMLVPTVLWKAMLKATGNNFDQFADPLDSDFLGRFQAYRMGENELFGQVWDTFKDNFFNAPVLLRDRFTPFLLCVLFTVAGVALGIFLWRRGLRGNAIYLFGMPFFFFVYTFALFYTYITMMSPTEGINNASYDRYMATFFIGWLMLLVGSLFNTEELKGPVFSFLKRAVAVAILSVMFVNFMYKNDLYYGADPGSIKTSGNITRQYVDNVVAQLQPYFEEEDNIWVLAPGNRTIHIYIFKYCFMPVQVLYPMPISFEVDVPAEEYIQRGMDEGIDYLLLYSVNEEFVENFSGMFSDGLDAILSSRLPVLYAFNGSSESPCFEYLHAVTNE